MSLEKKMLIEARHPEEVRVAIVKNNRLVDYDAEVAEKRPLKSNIYLARVTRVETSLQAVFVDYGANRHGFLPFSEISLDYFQLDPDTIQRLKQEEITYVEEREREKREHQHRIQKIDSPQAIDANPLEDYAAVVPAEAALAEDSADVPAAPLESMEDLSPKDALIYGMRHGYKVHEVIQKDQLILVQVVKEERGNKGASLTTYLSIAGRYCVLMPNTLKGGGISRKIGHSQDRDRLRHLLQSLNVSEGMHVIIRTAGVQCSDEEIHQDYTYLNRLWMMIQEESKVAVAPALIYEEANLIKRVLRDLLTDDVESIIVEGNDAYYTLREFAQSIAPDVVRKISLFPDSQIGLFKYHKVDDAVEALYGPVTYLKSGGYLVFLPSEALTTIDVNSGRATSESSVEETALRTNLEAADEIARQLRLRNIAGLVVVDFIDMDLPKNRLSVERRMRDSVKWDRARVHFNGISDFGILEMSRQRLAPSLVEKNFHACPKCQGLGRVRPVHLNALHIFNSVISALDTTSSAKTFSYTLEMPSDEAFYLLNNKRSDLSSLEKNLNIQLRVVINNTLLYPYFKLEPIKTKANTHIDHPALLIDEEVDRLAFKASPDSENRGTVRPHNRRRRDNNAPRPRHPNDRRPHTTRQHSRPVQSKGKQPSGFLSTLKKIFG